MFSEQLKQGSPSLQAFWDICIRSDSMNAKDRQPRAMLRGIIDLLGVECGCLAKIDDEDNLKIVESCYAKGTSLKAPTQLVCRNLALRAVSLNKSCTREITQCSDCDVSGKQRQDCLNTLPYCAPIEKTNGDQFLLYLTSLKNDKSYSEFDKRTIDFICRHVAPECIRKQIENGRKDISNSKLEQRLRRDFDFQSIVGSDPRIIRILELIIKVKDLDVPVLIEGESGTGKEMIARAIHYNSKRKKEPLICINCGAIPENLMESELFGHERGAFTGATHAKTGQVKAAGDGTIFLDEIDDLSFGLQVKLLRVLQWGEFMPVGSSKPEKTKARFIAASKHDLKKLVDKGSFRDDLFYRLNVLRLPIPPLRERKNDIPMLCRHFLEKHARKLGKNSFEMSKAATDALMNYDFPGNIRELENILQRAIILSESTFIDSEHLPFEIRNHSAVRSGRDEIFSRQFKEAKEFVVKDFERDYIQRKLAENQGVILRAAKLAGMYEANFRQKMKKYGMFD